MKVRLATVQDIPDIMQIEQESFGEDVGVESMATEALMRDRLTRCNAVAPGWFWVAVSDGVVCGYLILQPTTLDPDLCTSWDMATDSGTLRQTFKSEGGTIFGVSLGVGSNAPTGTFYMLVYRGVLLLASTRKKRILLCSRLPRLQKTLNSRGIAPEVYWKQRDRSGAPRDPLLNMFYSAFGVGPYKFMPNGWPTDEDSGGHAALIVVEDPYLSLELLAERIYAAGGVDAKRTKKGEKE